MKKRETALLVLIATLVILSGCGGVGERPALGEKPVPPPISITFIGAQSQTVTAGQTITVTVTVANDSSGRGVTWSLSGPGTLTKPAATSVEYDAPTAAATTATATVTATSVSDSTKSNSLTITITQPAIAVSVTPNLASLSVSNSQQFTATVENDVANKGVTWALTQSGKPCSPGCGAISPTATAGTPTTYTAPGKVPTDHVVTLTATSVTDNTKSASAAITITPPPVAVSIEPPSAAIQAGGAQVFTANVSNDPSGSGVTWAIVPSSGAGTLSDVTKTSVTYRALSNPPVNNFDVTLVATSVADPTTSQSAAITVLSVTISISPKSASIPVNGMQTFTATVANDPGNKGVAFALTQNGLACAPSCGTVTATAPGGTSATYAAPATVPSNPNVTLTATSAADSTKSDAASLKITAGTVMLVPGTLAFGNVKIGKSTSRTTTLTNIGAATLKVESVAVTGANAGDFVPTSECGTTVAAGVSCTITVVFKPIATGQRRAVLSISDDSAGSPEEVELSGTGLPRAALNLSSLAATDEISVPPPSRSNAIGTRVMRLVDSDRGDPYLADGTRRELMVRFWYPASSREDCKLAEYTSPTVWNEFSQLLGVPLPEVRTNSCMNAPVKNVTFPVVVFSHGYTGTFTDYTFLFEDLASRGYVVASVAHTYETTAVEFPDGHFVRSVVGSHFNNSMRSDEQTLSLAASTRLSDLKFVVTQLEHLNRAPGNPFTNRLELSRIAVAGHSLGGLAAILGVQNDPRFKAAIVIDGVLPERLIRPTAVPMFMLVAGREEWSDEEGRIWAALHGPRMAVNLKGAEHLTPTDAVWLLRGQIKTGAVGPKQTIATVREYVAAFLDANLRQKPNSLLTSPSLAFGDVTVVRQHQPLK